MSEQSPLGMHDHANNDNIAFSQAMKASSAPTTTGGTNIASQVSTCLQSFEDLDCLMNDAENEYLDQVQPYEIADELGRFRIWAGSMGAHRRGRSSLDFRLRDASHIKRHAQALLTDLDDLLQRTLQILRGDCIPWDKQMVPAVEEMEIESDDESCDDESLKDENELRQLLASIHETITFLLRLSVAIQNPAPHDHYLNSGRLNTARTFEKFDIAHVRETFPLASEAVVEVMGKAISRRREYFKYRELHSKRLSDGISGNGENENEDAGTEFRPLSTVASSIPQELKTIDHVLDLDTCQLSDTGITQTSIATSGEQHQSRTIPPIPQEVKDDEPFPCPYCFMIISVHSRRSWKRHVLKDLQPYTCTFPSCLSSRRLFERRHEWFEHEMQHHRREWTCPNGCQTSFKSRRDVESHFRDVHYGSISSDQLALLVEACGKSPKLDLETSCVLCGESLMLKQLERHLGKHQTHLALFALPDIAESEGRDTSDARSDATNDTPARSSSQQASSEAPDDEIDTNEDIPRPPPHVPMTESFKELLFLQKREIVKIVAAKKEAADDAVATASKNKEKAEEDKLAKLNDLLVAQREEQKARDEAIAAARAVEKAEANDVKAFKDAVEEQNAAQNAANLSAATKKAREEAEVKATEDANVAKEAYEKAFAEAEAAAKELEKETTDLEGTKRLRKESKDAEEAEKKAGAAAAP